MFHWCLAVIIVILPLRSIAQLSEPYWLNPQRQTELLQQAIELYSCIVATNKWYTFPDDLQLNPGDTNVVVPALQHNLFLTKDLKDKTEVTTVYDSSLVAAVNRFQERHGLKVTGKIGSGTVTELNILPIHRLKLLQANLERWKATTAQLQNPVILINIPDYRLYLLDSTRVQLQMRIIVGSRKTPTYINSTELLSIVVNPVWNLPRSIAVNEIIPILRRNPGYLNKRNIHVYLNGRQVNPWRINWKKVNASNFNYQFVQQPGKQNELGKYKFLYESKASQYMHDTFRRQLFDYMPRDFSHGCIRLEKPYELALYLLQNRSNQSEEKAKELLSRWDRNLYLRIRKPMPIRILYQTCWVSQHGDVQFRKDVYGYENQQQ